MPLALDHRQPSPALGFLASGVSCVRLDFGLLLRGWDAWQLPLLPTARRAPCRRGVDSIAVASETVCGPVELSSRPRSAPIFLALLEPPQRSLSHRGNSSRANHGGKMTQRLGDSCGFLLAPRHQHRTPGLGFAASGGLRLRWGFGLLQRGSGTHGSFLCCPPRVEHLAVVV